MAYPHLPLRVRIFSPVLRVLRPAWVASIVKRIIKIQRLQVQTKHGLFYVDPISHLGNLLISEGVYESAMISTLGKYLSPGAVFVDVGANEGYFSVHASALVGAEGRVLAIEPQSRLQAVLLENFALNRCGNIKLVSQAVSDSDSTADFYLTPDTNSGASGLSRVTRYSLPTEAVQTTTLTKLITAEQLGPIDLMKMDIEGFEYEALFGAESLLRSRQIKALALELHPAAMLTRGLDPARLVTFLNDLDYFLDPSSETSVFLAAQN